MSQRLHRARLAIGAEREQVDLAAHARLQVLVGIAPGILGQRLDVAPGRVVARLGFAGGLADQRFQTLLRRRISVVVELVHVELRFQDPDVLLCLGDACLVGVVHNLGHHDRGQDAENHDHDHDLD